MADCPDPPPGYHFYENKPSAYDYSTPTPGYATYGYKRNEATLPSQPEMHLQPDTRPISHEQLVAEVKGIYAGMVMVEAKCIDIDERQSAAAQKKDPFKKTDIKNDQYQSLIAFHKQLLHEKHDSYLSMIYQDKPDNRPMQNTPKTISPKDGMLEDLDALLEDLDNAEEDTKTSLFTESETSEASAQNAGNRLQGDKNDNQNEKIEQTSRSNGFWIFRKWSKSEDHASGSDPKQEIPPQTPVRPNVGRRFLRTEQLVDSPRSVVFKMQEEEQQKKLTPIQPTIQERRDISEIRQRALHTVLSPPPPRPPRPSLTSMPTKQGHSFLKAKQGLIGFANGSSIAAMADTGSRKNVISASYAKKLDLRTEGLPSTFKIGNSRKIQSIGNSFLTATKTLTEFCHRLTKCLFEVVNNILHFGFLGETCQRLHGTLADNLSVLAIPDTGADRNVMSLQYALENGLEIKTGPKYCNYLQFADGSYDPTVGQVKTHWTFASGERIPVTFEVLEYCCSDVIIGEEILTEHNVFLKHEASIFLTAVVDDDCFELAPFDFVNSWQKGCEKLMLKAGLGRAKDDSSPRNGATSENAHLEEQHRRNVWNHKYAFGTKASLGEGELERARRERYESLHGSRRPESMGDQTSADGNGDQQTEQRMPVVPSIPTSQTPR